ncbi:unnamed protein product [Allacma fusca]|uniref:Uncharacterized protein n=1 Tax=Allacma fusca TaxID=39272 RepID=A0A8J2JC19_9HEXA|nr:unnamed protein product [Allacma fusca]
MPKQILNSQFCIKIIFNIPQVPTLTPSHQADEKNTLSRGNTNNKTEEIEIIMPPTIFPKWQISFRSLILPHMSAQPGVRDSRRNPQNWMRNNDIIHNCPGNNLQYHTLSSVKRRERYTSIPDYAYCVFPGRNNPSIMRVYRCVRSKFLAISENDLSRTKCRRTEMIRAEIRIPVLHRGRDFTEAEKNYTFDCLQPERGDQFGHIIAATLGGTNQTFLKSGPDNRIYLELRLQYAQPNDTRPDHINLRIQAHRGNQERLRFGSV